MNPKPTLHPQCCPGGYGKKKATELCCWRINRDVGNSTVKESEDEEKRLDIRAIPKSI